MKKLVYLLAFVFAVGTSQVIATETSAAFAVECEKCGDKSKSCSGDKEAKKGEKACCKKAENKSCAAKTDAEKEKCHSKKDEKKAE